ncbi:MAG TPA: hypothetical protein VK745_33095 [Polyangiaceae bacterium]|jgi:hypothetical protein|nr:hypothetical protein [Polyangiaceae bacterium]
MAAEEYIVAAVISSLEEHGQAVRQYVTQTIDGNSAAPADIIFSPNHHDGRVVCIEVRLSVSPTLSGASLASVLRHKKVVEGVNPGTVFAFATNAALSEALQETAEREGLEVLRFDPDDPAPLGGLIRQLAINVPLLAET